LTRILAERKETQLFSRAKGRSAWAENHFSLSVFIRVNPVRHPWLIFFGGGGFAEQLRLNFLEI